jgi:hypothetical protein
MNIHRTPLPDKIVTYPQHKYEITLSGDEYDDLIHIIRVYAAYGAANKVKTLGLLKQLEDMRK